MHKINNIRNLKISNKTEKIAYLSSQDKIQQILEEQISSKNLHPRNSLDMFFFHPAFVPIVTTALPTAMPCWPGGAYSSSPLGSRINNERTAALLPLIGSSVMGLGL